MCGVQRIAVKQNHKRFRFGLSGEIMTFNLLLKEKKQSTTVNRSGTVAKALSTNISIVLMKVSVPVENGSSILIIGFSITSPYNGLFKSSP
jgi:hypothetical protein